MCHKTLVDKIKALSQFWKHTVVAFLLTDHIINKNTYKG